MPSTRPEFWREKLGRNVERDCRDMAALRAMGWRVLTVWECATRDSESLVEMSSRLSSWIEGDEVAGEVSLLTHP